MEKTVIRTVENYYGSLHIGKHEGKFYWIIENYDTEFSNIDEWTEINEELYLAILNNWKSLP